MKFIVAVDGSEEGEAALAYATDFADGVDGSITVVYAVDPEIYEEGGSEPIEGITDAEGRLIVQSVEDAEDRGLEILDEAAEFAEALGHDVETELLYGDPVPEITDYAEEGGYDGIFVGHRGLSERAERVLGSVAKGIVERATVPVTVVR